MLRFAELVTAGQSILLVGAIFLYMGLSGELCSRIAARKKRGPDEWFVCGELFGMFAVAALLLLPALTSPAQSSGTDDTQLQPRRQDAAPTDKGAS